MRTIRILATPTHNHPNKATQDIVDRVVQIYRPGQWHLRYYSMGEMALEARETPTE